MVEVTVVGTELVVTLRGWDRFWALKRRIAVPMSAIATIKVAAGMSHRPKGLRLPGTYLPKVITAGSYRSRDERSFWCAHRATELVVIELEDQRYDRLVLEVSDPQRVVSSVANHY